MSNMDFTGRVAIVTGGGGSLGRAYALALASRGAKVLVNDLGCGVDGRGRSPAVAQAVVDEIVAAGGQALANTGSVASADNAAAMVAQAVQTWGRIDILVHGAGFLRDKKFVNTPAQDFRDILDVHLMGPLFLSQAAWPHMVAQKHGRIVFNTTSAALFGHAGQANYGAANLAVVGMMRTMALEGAPLGIHVNALSPTARSRLTAKIIPEEVLTLLTPEAVVPALLALACDAAPNNTTLCAGGGTFEVAQMVMTPGVFLGSGEGAASALLAHIPDLSAVPDGLLVPASAEAQVTNEVWVAMSNR